MYSSLELPIQVKRPWMEYHEWDHSGIIGMFSTWFFMASCGIIFARVFYTLSKAGGFRGECWAHIAAFALSAAEYAVVIKLTTLGFGVFNSHVPVEKLIAQRPYIAVYNTFYALVISASKLSCVYALNELIRSCTKLTGPTRLGDHLKWATGFLVALPIAYGVISVVGINIACYVHGAWGPTVAGANHSTACSNFTTFWFAMGIVDIASEIALTISMTWFGWAALSGPDDKKLRTPTAIQHMLRLTVAIAAVWRVIALKHQYSEPFVRNISFESSNTTIATQLEIFLGIITCSGSWIASYNYELGECRRDEHMYWNMIRFNQRVLVYQELAQQRDALLNRDRPLTPSGRTWPGFAGDHSISHGLAESLAAAPPQRSGSQRGTQVRMRAPITGNIDIESHPGQALK